MFDMLRILIFCATTASLFGFIAANSVAENVSMTQIWRKCPFGTMNYLNASMTQPIQIDCADICPPDRTTDSSIFYCWVNCQDFLECFLNEVENGENVTRDLQQRATRPNTCPSDTSFYHINHGFVPCHTVCSTLNKFCRINCPDLYTCLVRSKRLNHSTTTTNLHQFPISELNLRTAAAPTRSSDVRQPPREIATTTAATTPTAHLNTVMATPFLKNKQLSEPESHDTLNLAYDKLWIAKVCVAIALTLVIFVLPIVVVLLWRRCRAKRAQVSANRNRINRNPDGPRDNLSTRTPTPTNSHHGYQDTEPPADYPPTVSSFVDDMPPHHDDEHRLDETTPKTPLIGTNNECPACLDSSSSGLILLMSCDCPQPAATEADNENIEASHTRLNLDLLH